MAIRLFSIKTFTPLGISIFTGWDKPIFKESFVPSNWALNPMPSIISFFSKPAVTPFIILFIWEANVPQTALLGAPFLKDTATILSAIFTSTSLWTSLSISPNGPSTFKTLPFNLTSTLSGICIPFFPMWLINKLIYFANYFPAYFFSSGFFARKNSFWGGQYLETETLPYFFNLGRRRINPSGRLGNSFQARYRRPVKTVVIQNNINNFVDLLAFVVGFFDEFFFGQNFRYFHFYFGIRNRHRFFAGGLSVSY